MQTDSPSTEVVLCQCGCSDGCKGSSRGFKHRRRLNCFSLNLVLVLAHSAMGVQSEARRGQDDRLTLGSLPEPPGVDRIQAAGTGAD